MALEKLLAAFRACNGPYPYGDFVRILWGLGYERIGKTKGSVRKFFNQKSGHIIRLHEPHNGEMGIGMVRRLKDELSNKGLLE
jgi:hypothetical protein